MFEWRLRDLVMPDATVLEPPHKSENWNLCLWKQLSSFPRQPKNVVLGREKHHPQSCYF